MAVHTQVHDIMNTKELGNWAVEVLDRKLHSKKGQIKNAETTYSRTSAIGWAEMEKGEEKNLMNVQVIQRITVSHKCGKTLKKP